MESWNHIIHTALLGTEKKSLRREDVDADIAESFDAIAQQVADKEDVFLQTAALVYNYRQCGFVPIKKETALLPIADNEEEEYAFLFAHGVLQDIVDAGSASLLRLWLEQCAASHKIIHPEIIPRLLSAGVKNKEVRHLVKTCCGRRGEWLAQFNAEWKWSEEITEEELWQTGTLAQRSAALAQMRTVDPAKALELLQQTWPQESAANKTGLVEQLLVSAGDDDVAWLEEVLNEKSVKVKEAALQVLKTIPSSSIIQSYWNILRQSIHIVTSKGILGIGAKTKLEVNLIPVDESVFKTGVERQSGKKGISDESHILSQLLSAVPPGLWKDQFSLNTKEIIKLFFKDEECKTLIPALLTAAVKFNDIGFINELIEADAEELHPLVFASLQQPEAEKYALRFLQKPSEAETIIQYLSFFPAEWSYEFAIAVLPHLCRFPYQFNRGFFYENVHRIPVSAIPFIDVIKLADQYQQQTWDNVGGHLKQLLFLKQQTLKAFNQ